ncbi:hypothetical protein PF005_g26524 [Phytophthora fragariae]|uniref:Uncharacterized protein n=1 Tax=Phytophthora fragariae TaxID=53985 RepID=A0A6A3HXB9_9STRA|nr:hypothetical protein PF009_g27123 [Phytophthora fragariae]KAE8972884.1 hypothetical protein PF011_g25479 [Phytophthora fragariae]KAE9070314.1 hypothetical protein PF007_g26986 [Phytophthora fragariae]KAE9070501.1 hypothetical protein PF010_g26243 [Phytophthora fragariae]KAE9074232.1 hypothetical protein PF006_g28581 [Phytophthora fragariae]
MPLWTFEAAMERGHASLGERMFSKGAELVPDRCIFDELCNVRINAATRDGDLDTVTRFVRYVPGLIVTMAVEEAAANAQLQILDWLNENAPLVCWVIYAYRKTRNNGHLTVLKWLNKKVPRTS